MQPHQPLNLGYPFQGKWQVRNSPANRVPSHGITLFGLSYAIDFVPVDDVGRSAPFRLRSLFRPEPPESFVGFGRPVLSPIDGVVIGVHDKEVDHHAYRGFPSMGYALTQRRRAATGWQALSGNHVLIETPSTTGNLVVALCHLKRGSISVNVGQSVRAGDPIARCGNSGNSTEPHLHLQVVDGPDVAYANAVPIRFIGGLPRNGSVVEPD